MTLAAHGGEGLLGGIILRVCGLRQIYFEREEEGHRDDQILIDKNI
jgi:hypothetical protein